MTVRCCRTYEEVHEGDIGRVTKLDRDGLHDLNVQVSSVRFLVHSSRLPVSDLQPMKNYLSVCLLSGFKFMTYLGANKDSLVTYRHHCTVDVVVS